jgi:hypothetical protein
MAKSSTKAEDKAPPVFVRRVFTGTGSVEVAVWEKKSSERTVYSVTIRRTWRNDEGQWHSSDTLRPEDVLAASQFLQDAFRFLVDQNGKRQ